MIEKSFKDITPYNELADSVKKAVDTTDKPIILVLSNIRKEVESIDIEELIREARRTFLDRGIPIFDNLKDAFQSLYHVSNYYYCNHTRAR